MSVQGSSDQSQLKPSVIFTGTAKDANVGPPVGVVDIGVSEGAYLFRVALPGCRKDQCNIKCDVQRDGRVHIEGTITDGGVFKNSSMVYQMKVQQLCPPGPFTISFKLPGPVDPRLFSPSFRPDGILEVIVMKYTSPNAPVNGSVPPSSAH